MVWVQIICTIWPQRLLKITEEIHILHGSRSLGDTDTPGPSLKNSNLLKLLTVGLGLPLSGKQNYNFFYCHPHPSLKKTPWYMHTHMRVRKNAHFNFCSKMELKFMWTHIRQALLHKLAWFTVYEKLYFGPYFINSTSVL